MRRITLLAAIVGFLVTAVPGAAQREPTAGTRSRVADARAGLKPGSKSALTQASLAAAFGFPLLPPGEHHIVIERERSGRADGGFRVLPPNHKAEFQHA